VAFKLWAILHNCIHHYFYVTFGLMLSFGVFDIDFKAQP